MRVSQFKVVLLEYHVWWVSRHLEMEIVMEGVIAPEGIPEMRVFQTSFVKWRIHKNEIFHESVG